MEKILLVQHGTPSRQMVDIFLLFFFLLQGMTFLSIKQVSSNGRKLDSGKYEAINEHHIQISRHCVL
jgi:hypothetical protein